jgi:hypothetical protein
MFKKQYIPLERRSVSTRLHDTSQKTIAFILSDVRTWTLTMLLLDVYRLYFTYIHPREVRIPQSRYWRNAGVAVFSTRGVECRYWITVTTPTLTQSLWSALNLAQSEARRRLKEVDTGGECDTVSRKIRRKPPLRCINSRACYLRCCLVKMLVTRFPACLIL